VVSRAARRAAAVGGRPDAGAAADVVAAADIVAAALAVAGAFPGPAECDAAADVAAPVAEPAVLEGEAMSCDVSHPDNARINISVPHKTHRLPIIRLSIPTPLL
jgi:hypothetical protein